MLDPSSGSFSSQPGYAISEAGVEVDSGVIDMPVSADLTRRLYYLGRTLREQFPEKFDVVGVEDVPTHRFRQGRNGRTYGSVRQQLSLHKAVAVVEASFDVRHVLHVSPATWRTYASEDHLLCKEMGEATDEQDAQAMLYALIQIARAAAEYRPRTKKKARKKTGGK